MALLAIAVLATAAGMRGYAGFATWAATASDDVLAQLGLRFRRPSEKTFRAVLSRLDPADLNARMGSYFTAHVPAATPVDWCRSRWTQDAAWCFTRQSDSHASRVGVRPPCPIGARSTRCRREKQ
ncbi:DDE_Tnp_1-associated family protein [Mycobacterium ulcerans str. Harvey]|uniref:DDE_Tnp_1-associated family protein n=1 Tax=Mycobacterium ulcerans str. Harvey TaxID=1299332 RepID=A0ABN0QMG7_MYCUL|nr:DDE_Tnp_1-associated family protein [Mycobacterium ulcerans str. Harvey]